MSKLSLSKSKIPVLLLENIHQNAVDNFKRAGYENIDILKSALDENELIEKLKNYKIVGVRSRTQLSNKVLENSKHIVAIGCFCIGTNQVHLDTAQRLGIPVFNAPFSNTRSVAELVLAEMILLIRNVIDKNAKAHRGLWQKSADNAHEVRGKTLGIIGYGHIGTQLGILAESIGMNVIFYDVQDKLPLGNANQVKSLQDLLSQSDAVSLHVPQLASTENLISQKEFSQMKKNSVLINASRGNTIDIPALCEALESKHIKGAALDVFPQEPSSQDEEFDSPLREFDNVFLTPHIGGSTQEAQENIASEVSTKLIKYSDNGSTIKSVNFPEISLSSHEGSLRLLHIHKNIPGIINKINTIFANNDINVTGQSLSTYGDIGYVVIDIQTSIATIDDVIKELKNIPETIKVRFLR